MTTRNMREKDPQKDEWEILQKRRSDGFLVEMAARYWMLGASARGRPRGTVGGGRREEGSGWGTHVYLWRIHFDIWQN